jgi:peptidyl-tRNA hydrolase
LRDYTQLVPSNKDSHYYIYSITRKDLEMPTGKHLAQAGHAYTDTLIKAETTHPLEFSKYRNRQSGGSKVAMKAKNEDQLIHAYNLALECGLPCAIVVDQEHILEPHFDGSPIITALGIGPCTKAQAKHITKKFQCI